MKPSDPHAKSHALRRLKPNRRPVGIFCVSVVFIDTALLLLGFFAAVSPFILQPGINVSLPAAPFSGGARFGALVLSITRSGDFYFNDERLDAAQLPGAFRRAEADHPGQPLIIEADEQIAYGKVVEAWNAALAAGIADVSLATRISALGADAP